jgi:DNA-binding LytR/AlgR family response regulator
MAGKRILIVEDEFIIAANLRQVLVDLGYDVIGHAFDANEALDLLRQNVVDLVLIDIRLGSGMDGIELAGLIRAESTAPFVFLTSHSDSNTVSRAKEVHPAGYLLKPFNKAEVFATIEIVLANREAAKQVDHIFIKVGTALRKVKYAEITMLKADRVYTEVHRTEGAPLLVRESLNAWEEKLPADFLRVHRSYIVHLPFVDAVDAGSTTVAGKEIPVTRQVRELILGKLGR